MKFSKVLMACLLVTTTSFVVAQPKSPNQLCFPGGKPVPPGYIPKANEPKPSPKLCRPSQMQPTQPGTNPMTPGQGMQQQRPQQ